MQDSLSWSHCPAIDSPALRSLCSPAGFRQKTLCVLPSPPLGFDLAQALQGLLSSRFCSGKSLQALSPPGFGQAGVFRPRSIYRAPSAISKIEPFCRCGAGALLAPPNVGVPSPRLGLRSCASTFALRPLISPSSLAAATSAS